MFIQAQNLDTFDYVHNGNFEDYALCPDNWTQICRATFWDDAMNCNGSSEYYNLCSLNPNIIIPLTTHPPRSGVAMAGNAFYVNDINNYREYIQNELKDTLKSGHRYCATMYVKLGTYNRWAIRNLYILFTQAKFTNLISAISTNPQVKNLNGIISDSLHWTPVRGTFISDGTEQFLTIGNFDSCQYTDKIVVMPNYPSNSYYYIDDVSVCECNFQFNLGNDTTLCPGEELKLYATVPNGEFTWQDGSHGNTFTVTQSGTYWAKAYFKDYDYTSYDTIVVNYGDETFCAPPLDIPNVITPNNDGANDRLVITNSNYWNISLMIYNRWGNLIYQNANYQNDFDCNGCGESVYFYVLQATAKRSGRKIEKTGTVTVLR